MSQPNDDALPAPAPLDEAGTEGGNPLGIPDEALQGLLSRFGPGIGELLTVGGGGQRAKRNQKVQKLLEDLQAMGEEERQFQALIELCDYFNMSMEELLGSFPADRFVPPLVELLHYEHNPDMMLLATRALSYMIEALPKSAKIVVRAGAVPVFCARLLCIQYIDVAEQTLQILGKLAKEQPAAVLEAGGLMAILTYLDFFSLSVQRSSVATAALLCRNVSRTLFESVVVNVLPLLAGLLTREDHQVVDSAILAFQRLSKSVEHEPACIALLASEGFVKNCLDLLSGGAAVGLVERPGGLFNILEIVGRGRPAAVLAMLEAGVGPVLANALQGPEQAAHTPTPNARFLLDILGLAGCLLPALPASQRPIEMHQDRFLVPAPPTEAAAAEAEAGSPRQAEHEALLQAQLPLFSGLAGSLFGPVKETFSTNILPSVRSHCLAIIMQVVHFLPAPALGPILENQGTSSFVASLLASNRLAYVGTALRLTAALMEKLPTLFAEYLRREGAVYELNRLTAPEAVRPSADTDDNMRHMKLWISAEAQRIQGEYFCDLRASTGLTDEFRSLEAALQQLASPDAAQQDAALATLASMFHLAGGGISAFEFLRSGTTPALFAFLTAPHDSVELQRRWSRFDAAMELGAEAAPLRALLTLLQNCLTQTEKFVVVSNDAKGYGSGLKYLGRPFKLRLQRAPDEVELADFAANSVGIEPLASVQAVEEFLWRKIKPLTASGELRRGELGEERGEVVIEDNVPDEPDESRVASPEEPGLQEAPPAPAHHLELYFEGKRLPYDKTILAVAQTTFLRALNVEQADNLSAACPARKMWGKELTLTYKRAPAACAPPPSSVPLATIQSNSSALETFVDETLRDDSELVGAGVAEPVRSLLLLMKFLHGYIGLRAGGLAAYDFVCNKIMQQLSQQLLDTLVVCSGTFPLWCGMVTSSFAFLVPFELRRQYFACSSLGLARALHTLQRNAPPVADSELARGFKIGRIQRQKVRIFRSRILASALRVFELYGASKAVLEIEFFGEAGTGLGPTLEFFTLASHQMQRRDLGLWAHDGTYTIESDEQPAQVDRAAAAAKLGGLGRDAALQKEGPFEYVRNSGGLFPAPLAGAAEGRAFVEKMFRLLGHLVGKAVLDERMLDIHLSTPFFKWMMGLPLGMADLAMVYPAVAKNLVAFQALSQEYHAALAAGASPEAAEAGARFNGAPLASLDIYFVLPGNGSWVLKEGGADLLLTCENAGEYVDLVLDQLLVSGVQGQMEAFRAGVEASVPLSALQCFGVHELEGLICGWKATNTEYWTPQAILDAVVCDHQYTSSSLPVQYFANSLGSFTDEEKRKFVRFLTGSPKLPIGGFKSLQPRLTVVRKETEGPADGYLPSVMTCVNYVKLPSYSSQAVAAQQIRRAIHEGQGSFHLS